MFFYMEISLTYETEIYYTIDIIQQIADALEKVCN